MKVVYRSEKLKKVCTDQRLAIKKYGRNNAKWLVFCLTALESHTFEELITNNVRKIHALVDNYAGCYAMRLDGGWRLIFSININGEVEIAYIEKIEDYH